jgi:two-component system OmpR family response regulator
VGVLIVDDYPDSAEMVSLSLTLAGFETVVATSGVDALAAMEAHKPNAAVLDLSLPDISGFELATRFRASAHPVVKNATLIAHSGLSVDSCRVRAAETGFDYILSKPCLTETIADCIRLARATESDQTSPVKAKYLTLAKVDALKMAALSERSQQAIVRAKNIIAKYGHLSHLLRDEPEG